MELAYGKGLQAASYHDKPTYMRKEDRKKELILFIRNTLS
jgi:hypothetical protein